MHIEKIYRKTTILRGFYGKTYGVEEFTSLCRQAKNEGMTRDQFFAMCEPCIKPENRKRAEEIWVSTLKDS